MKLIALAEPHLVELMQWFPDQQSCAIWAGPDFRYPFTQETFREDMRLQLPTYSLISDDGELLGSGQYYLRVGRCHLARLAISPRHRGRALGAVLIRELCQRGCAELNVDHCSLFVLTSNTPAMRLYTRLGFKEALYPGEMPDIEGCIYMLWQEMGTF